MVITRNKIKIMELTAKDFRIGNWIYHIEEGQYFQVEEICRYDGDTYNKNIGIRYREGSFWTDATYVTPIELTQDILKKCGFVGRNDFKWNGIVGVQIRNDKFYIALKDLSNVIFHSIVEIKYLHELQNFYYDCTKEELIFNK